MEKDKIILNIFRSLCLMRTGSLTDNTDIDDLWEKAKELLKEIYTPEI